ncbi:N-acetylmuramoyl-L-alanine amidase [Micromonospora sp. PLK6-60]|uniref:N-acetylmuramoyl-L-alanine amidase n=1 Tax=Micromonospora sp. PLK6-60 TaxID=2873383 RepID=UPI001CA78F57|nr:N-acetylmuramoyl-L-alanine amidase [Micromonospora sp. PLK6-60]MBY8871211.1 N-acetylmuramoyl-L-alanine amidase [Micromonospora sp. PLK6-60]
MTGIRWNRWTAATAAGAVAAAAAVTATVVATGPDGTDDAAQWELASGPVTTALHTVELPADKPTEAVLPQRRTDRFSMLGLTWKNPKAELNGTVSVRTRAVKTGSWSGWKQLNLDDPSGVDPGSPEDVPGRLRGASSPLWVGPSDGVEVRVQAASGKVSDKLPAGLRLDLIDPGEQARVRKHAAGTGERRAPRLQPVAQARALEPTADPDPTETPTTDPTPAEPDPTEPAPTATAEPAPTATAPAPAPTTAPAPAPTATTTAPAPATTKPLPRATATAAAAGTTAASTVPAPTLLNRAQWGADETLVKNPPDYGTEVRGFWVHHTATGNDYNCADSAAIVRAIFATDVKSDGYNDIGYNFLVDKCGTIYEGRKGGIDKPVVGAQTKGFNTDYSSIAVIGTFTTSGVSETVQNAIAHVAAYKLGPYGYDAAGSFTTTAVIDNNKFKAGQSVTLNRVPGHRDGDATVCPGDSLYNQLPTIRTKAARITGLKVTSLNASLNGGTYFTRHPTVTVNWTVTTASALINRFEVLLDGQIAGTVPGTARSGSARVTPGPHTLQVRAVHVLGHFTTTPALQLYGDAVAPTFTQNPEVALRTGTLSTTATMPVTVTAKANDNTAVRFVQILNSPAEMQYAPNGSWARTAAHNTATTWQVKAADWAGNAQTVASTRTAGLTSERSATRKGTWKDVSSTSHLGGLATTSSTKGSSLKWTFTGRSFALVAARSPQSGQADIYLDGVKAGTVDLYAANTPYRQAVWTKSWTASGSHTVEVVVVGTAGRPAVTVDGFAVVK